MRFCNRQSAIVLSTQQLLAKRSARVLERQSARGSAEIDIWRWRTPVFYFVNKMSGNIISETQPNDGKFNGLSAFTDKSLAPLNGRYRSKSLSSDKLNKTNEDRAAILEDVEAHHITAKSETPGCLIGNSIMDQGGQPTVNG